MMSKRMGAPYPPRDPRTRKQTRNQEPGTRNQRQTDRHANRRKDTQTDAQTHRHTDTNTPTQGCFTFLSSLILKNTKLHFVCAVWLILPRKCNSELSLRLSYLLRHNVVEKLHFDHIKPQFDQILHFWKFVIFAPPKLTEMISVSTVCASFVAQVRLQRTQMCKNVF